MPIPLWVPILLAAASTGANVAAQRKVGKARGRAMAEERTRRERKEKESAAKAKSTADLLVQSASDEKKRAGELEQSYRAAQTPAAPAGTSPAAGLDVLGPRAMATNTVADPRFAQMSRAQTDRSARSRAALGAFGDVMTGTQIATGRNAADIDAANATIRNWNQFVLPAQLASANTAGRGWNTLADLLQAASMVTSMGALSSPAAAGQTAAAPAAAGTEGQVFSKAGSLITPFEGGTTTQFLERASSLPGFRGGFVSPSARELEWLRQIGGTPGQGPMWTR